MVRFKPQSGFESEYTQSEANTLPPWHRIRFDPTATGQYLLNAWAMGISDINQFLKMARRNMYIGTADSLVRTHAYRIDVPQQLKIRPTRSLNILRNASFRRQGQAWKNCPLEWQVVSGEHYPRDAYVGHGSIKLSPNGYFYQIISGEAFRKGQTYTAGVYVKSSATGEEDNGVLRIVATGWGWSQSGEATFNLGTTGEWVQQEASIVPTGDIRTLKLVVESSPAGEIDTFFCGPIMQEGDSLIDWEPGNDINSDFRLFAVGPTGEEQHLIEMVRVANEYELFEDALPSRVVTTPGITGDVFSSNFAPPVYEWSKEIWDCEFRISGDGIEHYSVRIPADVWHDYSILDRYMDNEVNTGEYGYSTGEFGLTRSLEALCVWRHRIYLICKDTIGGNTYRVLKILRWQGVDDNLETIHELRVGMDTGDVSSIGFIDGRIDQLAITMDDDSEWTMQLYFDIFLYDPGHRQVIIRHPYTGYTMTFAEL